MTEEQKLPERCWISFAPMGMDIKGQRLLQVARSRPVMQPDAVEYMRVLSRQEVDKIAGEGVDVQQYINSLLRTIEGQRRHINRLENPSAHVAAGVTGHD